MPEKIKLEAKTFDNIVPMLNSPDQENIVVGMECLENSHFRTNLTYILLVKKMSNATADMWKKHAPETTSNLNDIGAPVDRPITYKRMLEIMVEYKVPPADLQFYLDKFGGHLKDEIKKMGYDFIDDVVIILQFKDKKHEPNTIRTTSKDLKGSDA